MSGYLLVGGPKDGVRLELEQPPHILVVPIPQPLVAVRYVSDSTGLTNHTTEYRRFGDTYWWEGLIEDARADLNVSDQMLVEGGPKVRRLIRDEMRDHLQALAPDKGLHRIIWRVLRDKTIGQHRFTAVVGPRAVEHGLYLRSKRRSC